MPPAWPATSRTAIPPSACTPSGRCARCSSGWSWADIARVLRVSKQSVHEKHAARRKALGLEA